MKKRERTTPEAPDERAAKVIEERLRSAFAAAYPRVKPADPLRQRVARETARYETEPDRPGTAPRVWWGIGRPAAGLLASALVLTVLSFCLVWKWPGRWTERHAAVVADAPRPSRRVQQTPPLPPKPPHDRNPLMAHSTSGSGSPVAPSVALSGSANSTPERETSLISVPPNNQSARSHFPSDEPTLDDLVSLNQDPKATAAQWISLAPDDWDRIEARVRQSIHTNDDFVRIPFPRMATASATQIVAAVEQYKKEAAIVDSHLSQEVTLHLKGAALSDTCDQLSSQTGVRIAAGRSVADEKVTILVEKLPLRQVMREINHLFGCTWLRTKAASGDYRYELEQDLRSQLLEEELRNRDRDASLVALDSRMQQFRPYLDLSFDELQQRAEQSEEVRRLLFDVMHNAGWAGLQLYYRLTPAQRSTLVAGQPLVFRPDAADADRRLPAEWQRPILQSWDNRITVDGKPTPMVEAPGIKLTQAWIKLNRSEMGQVSLNCGVSAAFGDSLSFTAPMQVATGRSPSAGNPDNRLLNAAMQGHSPFDQIVSLRPEPSCPRLKRSKPDAWEQNLSSVSLGNMGQPHVFSSDVWEALHRVTGLPIVADYYTRMHRLDRVTVERKSLFEALCTAADAMGVRWRKDGDVILCRSAGYFWDKLKEVPNRYLQRWTRDRDANGGLPLSDFLEMAAMPDQELDSDVVAEAIEHCWGLREWSYPHFEGIRQEARFLSTLQPQQLQRVLQPEGLPFGELTPAQQRRAIQLQLSMNAQGEIQTGVPGATDIDPRAWTRALVYASYAPAGWYVWTPPQGPSEPRMPHLLFPAVGRTPAEALAAIRRVWPEAPAGPVRQVGGKHFSVGHNPGGIDQAESGYFSAGLVWFEAPH